MSSNLCDKHAPHWSAQAVLSLPDTTISHLSDISQGTEGRILPPHAQESFRRPTLMGHHSTPSLLPGE